MGPGGGLLPEYYYYPVRGVRKTIEYMPLITAAATLAWPATWGPKAGLGAVALWKARGAIIGISALTYSPGGGGPGQSLTSTDPPPSIEEAGDMLMEISKTGRGYGFDIMKSRTSNGRRCPTGYRWDKKRRKCVRIRKD